MKTRTTCSAPAPNAFDLAVASRNNLTEAQWRRLPSRKQLDLCLDAASDAMGLNNISSEEWDGLSPETKAELLTEVDG